jgi:HEPN domain-containing protein
MHHFQQPLYEKGSCSMAPAAALIADTRSWLIKAANDLRGAEIDLAAEPPLLEDAVFQCQQAAEKAFKAFLTFHNQPSTA